MKNQLTKQLKILGFQCGIPYLVYTRDIGKYTSLVIEGCIRKPDSRYVYTFYKCTFDRKSGKPTKIVVYLKDTTIAELINRVKNYMNWFDNISKNTY